MELILKSAEVSIPQAIENLEQLKAEIIPKMEYYKSLVVTEDGIKAAKIDKANLNKLKKAIDDQRIAVKKQCLAPYEALERECKELEALIIAPIAAIDTQIKAFDEKERNEKLLKLKTAFYKTTHHSWVSFESVLPEKWANKTEKIEKLIEEINKEVERINAEYNDIGRMYINSPLLTAITDQYKRTRNKAETLAYAVTLEKQYQAEQESKAARIQKAETAQAENVKNAPESDSGKKDEIIPPDIQNGNTSESEQSELMLKGTFSVECTKSQLIALRDFMKSQGIRFEVIK